MTPPDANGSRELFAALNEVAEHSSDLIVMVNEAGIVVFANRAATLTFGVAPEGAIGTSVFSYIHPDDVSRVRAKFATLVSSPGSSLTDTIRGISADGKIRVFQTVSTNCLDKAAVAGIVINARDVTEMNEYVAKLHAAIDAVANSVANMVEVRDPYTGGHQHQVAEIATAIAQELSLDEDDVNGIEVASTIHDIGKIAVPIEILIRPGRLSHAEFEIIKTHSQVGHDIVSEVSFPWPVAEMILQHHERLDGSGYPRGLRGKDILLGARIVAVADVVSAMAEHRPYHPALGVDAALAEIEARGGELFDSQAVGACVRVFRAGLVQLTPSIATE
ncbi:MAG TPA: HD-GYP domain-containing protein [Acidimicrobiales bacterium]|nr:HD-GYP domain-containing protein [Acidimicrobiales bacterium]